MLWPSQAREKLRTLRLLVLRHGALQILAHNRGAQPPAQLPDRASPRASSSYLHGQQVLLVPARIAVAAKSSGERLVAHSSCLRARHSENV